MHSLQKGEGSGYRGQTSTPGISRRPTALRDRSEERNFFASPSVLQSAKSPHDEINLSRYFPRGTEYFYAYPSGQDSQFFSTVSPETEELIAARVLTCAGEHVTPVVFAPAVDPHVLHLLKDEMGMLYPYGADASGLQLHVSHEVLDQEWNSLVKLALKKLTHRGHFVMAQPFLDPALSDRFQIPPELTVWLNDKKNLPQYVPKLYLPERYAQFSNGIAFAASSDRLPLPCVVKVSSSTSGYGVRICRNALQLERARKEYVSIVGTIVVEQCINVVRNFGIQFGIPHALEKDVEIVGVSEQLTTPEGEFIGGIIDPEHLLPEIDGINRLLLQYVLPKVRSTGWYGIGGFDVLIDRRGRFFIGDPNFRMTGMTAYLCQARNGIIRKSMASFTAVFKGRETAFRENIVPLAREGDRRQLIHIIALTRHEDTFRMSAAMYFDQEEAGSIKRNAQRLLRLGLQSKALQKLGRNGRRRFPDFP